MVVLNGALKANHESAICQNEGVISKQGRGWRGKVGQGLEDGVKSLN